MDSIPLYEWEYQTFIVGWHSFETRSNIAGKLGWEVIAVVKQQYEFIIFLKRPKLFGVSVAKKV